MPFFWVSFDSFWITNQIKFILKAQNHFVPVSFTICAVNHILCPQTPNKKNSFNRLKTWTLWYASLSCVRPSSQMFPTSLNLREINTLTHCGFYLLPGQESQWTRFNVMWIQLLLNMKSSVHICAWVMSDFHQQRWLLNGLFITREASSTAASHNEGQLWGMLLQSGW